MTPRFYLENPHEFFASTVKLWFTDTALLLRHAIGRYARAEPGDEAPAAALDQFLLLAEYLSQGGDTVPFYRVAHPKTAPPIAAWRRPGLESQQAHPPAHAAAALGRQRGVGAWRQSGLSGGGVDVPLCRRSRAGGVEAF